MAGGAWTQSGPSCPMLPKRPRLQHCSASLTGVVWPRHHVTAFCWGGQLLPIDILAMVAW